MQSGSYSAAGAAVLALLLTASAAKAQMNDAGQIVRSDIFRSADDTYHSPDHFSIMQTAAPPALSSTTSSGGEDTELNLFGNFGSNILNSFKGDNLYLHLTAVASTILLVTGNVDYDVEHYFNTHPEYGKYGRGVFITGEFLPFIAGGSLLIYSGAMHDKETLGASFAVIQASLIEVMYNTALKAITGRPGPDWRHHSDMEKLSKTFRFGFLRGGVFWGWPSGHTAATTAVVASLMSYYPNSTWLKVAGFGLIGYTIFAVSSVNRGGMHWFSDAVAASLMAYAIGSTVGKYYREVYDRQAGIGAVPASGSALSLEASPMSVGFSIHF